MWYVHLVAVAVDGLGVVGDGKVGEARAGIQDNENDARSPGVVENVNGDSEHKRFDEPDVWCLGRENERKDGSVETGSNKLSRLNCFSNSTNCPRKLKLGDMVGLLDFTYL